MELITHTRKYILVFNIIYIYISFIYIQKNIKVYLYYIKFYNYLFLIMFDKNNDNMD